MLLKEIGKAKAKVLRLFKPDPARNPDPYVNGEYAFLHFAARLPEISRADAIFDVGANHGEWTAAALGQFEGTSISRFVCFEPVPTFLDRLHARYDGDPRVEIADVALSDRPEPSREIYEIGGGGRMYKSYRGAATEGEASGKKLVSYSVRVSTGDEATQRLKARPYLIKIDCDGHDLHVLRGFGNTLRQFRPLVQFEYSDFWIGAGSRLREACGFLRTMNYRTYKMYPDRLVRFRFNPLFETFGYQNIIAVPAEFLSFSGPLIPFISGHS